MDAALKGIVESEAPERLATGFEFTEGPLWIPEGYWIFVDIPASRIYRLTPGGAPEVIRADSQQSNGMTFDLQGRVLICEMDGRRVARWERDGAFSTVADRWDGKRLNRPNDIICASDGTVYFTDPSLRLDPAEKEQAFNGVYCLSPSGDLRPLLTDFDFPNGLALSPDEGTLYVANSRPDMVIRAYDRQGDGGVANGRVFADLRREGVEGVPDGMKVDTEGRVFSTGPGGCWVYSPQGELLGVIELPEIPANCAFGGADYRTLFFTARTSVYTVRVTTPGVRPPGAG